MSQLSIQSLQQLPGSEGLALTLAINQGIVGADGPNSVTSATTSDGTANLSVATISSQGAVLINPEFDNGILAEESGGRSVFRVGGVIISAAEGSVDCVQVDTETVNTTTLRASSTEYGNDATFTYGNATAVANHRDAMGLGTGDDVEFNIINTTELKAGAFSFFRQGELQVLDAGSTSRLVRLSRRGSNRGGISFANGSGGGYEVGFQWLSSTAIEANTGTVGNRCSVAASNFLASGTISSQGEEYGNDATFTYGNATAVANHLTALGGGATGVDVFQAATAGDARDAMGLGAGDDVTFGQITSSVDSTGYSLRCGVSAQFRRFAVEHAGGMVAFVRLPSLGAYTITSGYAESARTCSLSQGVAGQWLFGTGAAGSFAGSAKLTNLEAVGDIEASTIGKGVILKSPNGTRYRITVENDGTLTTTAL